MRRWDSARACSAAPSRRAAERERNDAWQRSPSSSAHGTSSSLPCAGILKRSVMSNVVERTFTGNGRIGRDGRGKRSVRGPIAAHIAASAVAVIGVTEFQARLEQAGYIAEPRLAATLLLFTELRRPLLVEGDAGGGKTEIAKALAARCDCALIRLQCYEGLDAGTAVYEWNYQRQLLAIKIRESDEASADEKERHFFSKDFFLERPLLRANTQAAPPVLLVDEIDSADEL